ncbi:hypothetical protein NEOLEDRAFT_514635 [Neolentinus lepideus HHB14362 ss-1]|uniref:Uncharacterized protein n=1 Tax=Neolentinus lepideus HHB14362 ss-1 TaxID=1314782 RepID=A0A165RGQ1_9AGAM|nr:hypothetical protein NEOLEDRAFT_514635 [Neolentinus lepideus HHB14362 ss-1]
MRAAQSMRGRRQTVSYMGIFSFQLGVIFYVMSSGEAFAIVSPVSTTATSVNPPDPCTLPCDIYEHSIYRHSADARVLGCLRVFGASAPLKCIRNSVIFSEYCSAICSMS